MYGKYNNPECKTIEISHNCNKNVHRFIADRHDLKVLSPDTARLSSRPLHIVKIIYRHINNSFNIINFELI